VQLANLIERMNYYFYSGRSLTFLCLAIQVFVWDFVAVLLRAMWYSTSSTANSSANPGTSIALFSRCTVRSSVNSGVFFSDRGESA
jgi:hypothetical protein